VRLRNINPGALTSEQRALYDTMRESIDRYLQGFVTSRSDGALIGPFNILLHFPALGAAIWDLFGVLAKNSKLSKAGREITILLTGAHFCSLYELYSHETVALRAGMSKDSVASLAVGQRPENLGPYENVVFDVVSALLAGKQLPNTTYAVAEECLSREGLAEIGSTIGCYAAIASLLNIFDVALPGTELAD
jgi:4-carboxymuconolactone decarboxylase